MLANSQIEIFKKLQSILQGTRNLRSTLGINNNFFLYPRKLDEFQLKRMKFLLTRVPKIRIFVYLCHVIIWVPFYVIAHLLWYLIQSFQERSLKTNEAIEVPLILISHGIMSGKSIKGDSFLSGILSEFSQETTYRVLLIPHFRRFKPERILDLQDKYEIISRHLSLRQFWISLAKNLHNSLKLCSMALTASSLEPLSRTYLARAARSQLSSGSVTLDQLAINLCLRLDHLHSRKVLIPYEGHALEIAFITQIQEKLPEVQIILFQHSAIAPSQLSFFEGLLLLRNKDSLVVTGELIEKIVLRYRPEIRNQLRVLGSDKNIKLIPGIKSIHERNLSLLITPEASAEAITDMYETLKFLVPKIDVNALTLRIHPRYEAKQLPNFGSYLGNRLRISDSKLVDDLSQNSICLYRSSAVVFQSMSVGLIPLYCSRIPPSLLDPLQLVRFTFPKEVTNWLFNETRFDNFSEWLRSNPSSLSEILTQTGTNYFSPLSNECIKWLEGP